MDELASAYLTLALRLGRRLPGLLEAYAGPAPLREAVEAGEPAPPFELHDDALRLHEQASTLQPVSPSEHRRREWLLAQTTSLAAAARLADGEEIALPELAEALGGMPVERRPDGDLLAAHRLLDAALPPGPSLRARLATHREATAIPAEQVPAAAERLVAVLRGRTVDDLGTDATLPPGEGLSLDPVHESGAAWHTRASPAPGGLTRLELNLAAAWSLGELVRAASAETYPGRHLGRAMREASADGRSDEALAWCRPAPESTLAHGLAVVGREVLLGDFELAGELRRIGRELGLRWEVERDIEVRRARERLAAAAANASLMLHHDGLPEPEVRGYLAEVGLLEAGEVTEVLDGLADPLRRVEPFARAQAPSLVRGWLVTVGQTDGLRRLLVEQLTPGRLRDEAGVAA
jgi:hypothetical protein